jgi:hypothetical protein
VATGTPDRGGINKFNAMILTSDHEQGAKKKKLMFLLAAVVFTSALAGLGSLLRFSALNNS